MKPDDITGMKSAIEQDLEEAVQFGEESPNPLPEDCLVDVFAEGN